MALTRDFKETIRARVERDPKFRKELLREGIECMLSGDVATAKMILRDYINATVGFTELAAATPIWSKSLMRMLGPTGNPRADALFEVVSFLQRREGVPFHVRASPTSRSSIADCTFEHRWLHVRASLTEGTGQLRTRAKPTTAFPRSSGFADCSRGR